MSEEENNQNQAQPQPPRRLFSNNLGLYYSNCMMLSTSPSDISIFFGRYVTAEDDGGAPSLAEFYERQVYLTPDQAEALGNALLQTAERWKQTKATVEAQITGPPPAPKQ